MDKLMYFTIDEADECLPEVDRLVRKAQKIRDALSCLLEASEIKVEVCDEDGVHYIVTENVQTNKQFHKLYYQFYCAVEKLNGLGVIVRDIDDGLIDFPFLHNGKELLLSWRLGEQKVRHWYDPDAGEEQRIPIVDMDEFL